MIVCPTCGHRNQNGANACDCCGASLAKASVVVCPICGTCNAADELYCLRCLTLLQDDGVALPANVAHEPAAPPEVPLDPLVELTQVLPPAQIDFSPPLAEATGLEVRAPAVEAMRLIANDGVTTDFRREVKRAKKPATRGFVQWIITSAILLAALVPFIVDMPPLLQTRARDSVGILAQAITNLPSGAVVLVSFDYGPTYAFELDPLAQAILTQLSQRSAKLLIMSTIPTGMGAAERVLADVRKNTGATEYGRDYLLLGYLAGEDSGLRFLTSGIPAAFKTDYLNQMDINIYPLVKAAPLMSQVQRVIVLAEDAYSVRRWIEQVSTKVPITLDAAVSASAEPILVPYYLSKQLSTLVGGLPAAVELSSIGNGQATDWRYYYSFAGLFLILVLVAIGTNVATLIQVSSQRS